MWLALRRACSAAAPPFYVFLRCFLLLPWSSSPVRAVRYDTLVTFADRLSGSTLVPVDKAKTTWEGEPWLLLAMFGHTSITLY